jgi:hypothetical protein
MLSAAMRDGLVLWSGIWSSSALWHASISWRSASGVTWRDCSRRIPPPAAKLVANAVGFGYNSEWLTPILTSD